jgi:TonB family protein
MTAKFVAFALVCLRCASAQDFPERVLKVGPGVTAPKVIRKVEPEYSSQARDAHVQGKVLFQLVVDENGLASDIAVLSPLGFGLDENAEAALRQWKFQPGMKEGKPVPIAATVEVHFRFQDRWYDERAERQRTSYNLALRHIQLADKGQADAVKSLQDLAKQKFAPAMHLVAMLMEEGKLLPVNPAEAYALLVAAAEKRNGPAMYEIGRRHLAGTGTAADAKNGLQLMKDAAVLGSKQAQNYLGVAYEKGDGVEQDGERSRRYYRLCAAARDSACQFNLARSLLLKPGNTDRDVVQAMAWLELAADQGLAQAKGLLLSERGKRTIEQLKSVPGLKRQLLPAN